MFGSLRDACMVLLAYVTKKTTCILPGTEGRAPLTPELCKAAAAKVTAYARSSPGIPQATTWGQTNNADGTVTHHTEADGLRGILEVLSVTPTDAYPKILPRMPWPLISAALNRDYTDIGQ